MKKRILFVDDEEIIVRSFCSTLNRKEYEASFALSGKTALALLQDHSYEVVVTDLKMPEMDGIQVLKAAKKLNAQVVVIVLTGYGDMHSAVDALRLGADDYIQKPCDIGELIFRMDRCLDKKELEKRLAAEKLKNDRHEMVSLLAGGLAHDFNNLLAGIMGAVEMADIALSNGESPALYFTWAMTACGQARDLVSQFNQVSDMYRPKVSVVPVRELLSIATEKLASLEKGAIKLNCAVDLPDLLVDREKVGFALEALVRNAVESVADGGEIILSAQRADGFIDANQLSTEKVSDTYLMIEIKDNGVGIPAENLEKIFYPYFSTKEKGCRKGMGLGLTIASTLIRKNQGHLSIESQVGKGTRVTVYLPGCEDQTWSAHAGVDLSNAGH